MKNQAFFCSKNRSYKSYLEVKLTSDFQKTNYFSIKKFTVLNQWKKKNLFWSLIFVSKYQFHKVKKKKNSGGYFKFFGLAEFVVENTVLPYKF